ncbi:MAG: BCCT family transporter [Caenispirillum bisanense]|nr:BCCT family transporter [Caenispirillum bisanense]MCA1972407.1 BCCT family transporter [Caenispirillum sp.]
MRAESGLFKGLNPTMALVALVVVALFLVVGTAAPETSSSWFIAVRDGITTWFKWYYVLVVALFLLFSLWLLFSRFGDLRLGDDDQQPEFGYFSWFAMLFGAGMGIGLVFWSIAEPIFHFQGNPFLSDPESPAAAVTAMRLTYFHWGLHPWAIYAIVALTLAFFSYRKKLPLAIRSALYPLIGDRIYGGWGHAVDVLAVFGTVFGVATSLGFGVTQINTGLNTLFGMEISTTNQVILIACISAVATLSVVSGVGKGVRILSEANLWMSLAILLFFFVFGPTRYLLDLFVEGLGEYMWTVIPQSFWTNAESGGTGTWQASWTAFYWGWWIAWAPFVGMFIARISRGRTIREFLLGVLLVPTLLGMLWLTVFGGTGLYLELYQEGAGIAAAVNEDVTLALYTTIGAMASDGIAYAAMCLVTLLIATYFITSSDSATLVVTTLLSIGDAEPPTPHRVVWGLGEGFVAAVLLLAGGLEGLQAASIIAALPFSIIMLFMCYGLVQGLREEKAILAESERRMRAALGQGASQDQTWPG